MLAHDRVDDVVDRRWRLGALPSGTQVVHQPWYRQPLGLGQRRAEHGGDQHPIGGAERAGEIVLEDAATRGGRPRFEDRPDARGRVRGAEARQGFGHRRWMVCEVVDHRHAAGNADHFEPPLHAGKGPQAFAHAHGVDADRGGHRDGGERIPDVVGAEQRHLELAEGRAVAPHTEAGGRRPGDEVVRLPVETVAGAERLHTRHGAADKRQRRGAVAAKQQQALPRHEACEPRERRGHRIHVGVDIRMVELDVVDDGDVGQILQELRGLVEERAVVFVALDDEVAPLPHAVARAMVAEIPGDAADEHARVDAGMRQHPAGQRRRRGLAVRAGQHDRARPPQELLANGLGQRAVVDLPVEHFLEFRVAARDRVADDDEVEVGGNLLGTIAAEDRDAFRREEVAHGRIDVGVGAADIEPFSLEHGRQRGHGRTADADEMHACGH